MQIFPKLLIFLAALLFSKLSSLIFAAERFLPSNEAGFSIMGTIVSADPYKSVVLIKLKTGQVDAFKLESMINSYRLISIDKRYVVVTDGRERLQVWLDRFASEGRSKRVVRTPGQPAPKGGRFQEPGFERNDPGAGQISVQMTGAYRDKLIKQDLQNILMQATALPHFQDGSIIGFSLTQIDADSIFAKGGFVDQDIITAVNGVPLNSIPGAIKLLNSLRESPSIDVEILRNNQKRNLNMRIQ